MDLWELVYVSQATRAMSQQALVDLLEQSREKNERLFVTGFLVYYRREFMQLLEGSREVILELYHRICYDDRNMQNYLLWEGPIERRSFANWTMAFLSPEKFNIERNHVAYWDFFERGLSQEIPGSAKTMGKTFLVSLRDEFLHRAS